MSRSDLACEACPTHTRGMIATEVPNMPESPEMRFLQRRDRWLHDAARDYSPADSFGRDGAAQVERVRTRRRQCPADAPSSGRWE